MAADMKPPATYWLLYTWVDGAADPYIHLYQNDESCMRSGQHIRGLHGKSVFSYRVAVRLPSRPFMGLHLAQDTMQ